MDWTGKIREVARRRAWTIKQLAGDLGVSQQFLNDVVNGKKPIPSLMKIQILDRLSFDITNDVLIELLPEDAGNALKNLLIKQKKWLGNKGDVKADRIERKEKKNGDKEA